MILTVSLPYTSRANECIRSWFCTRPAFDLCFFFFLADLGCTLLLSYKKREHFFYRSLQHAAAIIIGEPQVVWFMVFNVNHWGSVGRDYIKYKTFYRIVLQQFSSNFAAGLLHLSHCPKMTYVNACLLKSSLTIFKQLQKILMAVLMRVNHCWEQGAHQDGFLKPQLMGFGRMLWKFMVLLWGLILGWDW